MHNCLHSLRNSVTYTSYPAPAFKGSGGYKVRTRFWLYLLFGGFSLVPMLIAGMIFISDRTEQALQKAAADNQYLADTHARTIGNAYQAALLSFQKRIESNSRSAQGLTQGLTPGQTFDSYHQAIDKVQVLDGSPGGASAPGPAALAAMRDEPALQWPRTTKLMDDGQGGKVMWIYRHFNGKLVVARMWPAILMEIASPGSTAIVVRDEAGNILNNLGRNLLAGNAGSLRGSIVSAGLDSASGPSRPAAEREQITGTAGISNAGWQVSISQPVDAVLAGTVTLGRTIWVALMLTLALVLLASILLSDFMSKPLEQLSASLKKTDAENGFNEIELLTNPLAPAEHKQMHEAFNEMIAKLRNSHRQLTRAAYLDPTTQLPNREAFRRAMEMEIEKLAEHSGAGSLIFIELDNFKEINDTNGHTAGDQVLRFIGSRIAGVVETATGTSPIRLPESGPGDRKAEPPRPLVGRFGGDEFVLFLPEARDSHLNTEVIAQIMTVINAPFSSLDNKAQLNAHIGMSRYPDHGLTLAELLKTADIALYHAKRLGANHWTEYDPAKGSQNQAEIRRDVREAIVKGQMELYYQPKIHAQTGEVHAVEALVRWIHPERGLVPPSEFIPAIEDTDATMLLGEWVVERACDDMAYWESIGLHIDVAVNIATRHFISPDFVQRIAAVTRRKGVDPNRLEIEVTEETALSTHEGAAGIINALHGHGFRVSLDDYGRGYSNLTRLSELRVNTIKIDGPLTARLTRDERTRVIFEATINMAKGLKCNTVAEGVETAEEVAILTRLGCTELQGFFFSTPRPRDELASWVEERNHNNVHGLQDRIASNFQART